MKPITLYQIYMSKKLGSPILRYTVGILYIRLHYSSLSFLGAIFKSLAVLNISVQSVE